LSWLALLAELFFKKSTHRPFNIVTATNNIQLAKGGYSKKLEARFKKWQKMLKQLIRSKSSIRSKVQILFI
jgi:hypothetical protein